MAAVYTSSLDRYNPGLQEPNAKQLRDSIAHLMNITTYEGITALAGGGQTGATPLLAPLNRITVCASGGDSCMLPQAALGMVVIVANDGAASCDVFPFLGDNIDKAGANLARAVANAKRCIFFCTKLGTWCSLLGA